MDVDGGIAGRAVHASRRTATSRCILVDDGIAAIDRLRLSTPGPTIDMATERGTPARSSVLTADRACHAPARPDIRTSFAMDSIVFIISSRSVELLWPEHCRSAAELALGEISDTSPRQGAHDGGCMNSDVVRRSAWWRSTRVMLTTGLIVFLSGPAFAAQWGAWRGYVDDSSAVLFQPDRDSGKEWNESSELSLRCGVEPKGEATVFRTRWVLSARDFTPYPLTRKVALPYPISVRVKFDSNAVQLQTWSLRGNDFSVPLVFVDRLARSKQVQIEIREGCYRCTESTPPSRVLRFLSDGLAKGLSAVRQGCAVAERKHAAAQRVVPRLK